MKIYEEWTKRSDEAEAKDFYNDYFEQETDVYKLILGEKSGVLKGTCGELAERFGIESWVFGGFLGGINTSLEELLLLDDLTEESLIDSKIDFKKLLYNMHAAKASWLYLLKEWEDVLPEEKREEIKKQYRSDTTAVSNKVGRNEPCPCGSGKKYKKCCGQ